MNFNKTAVVMARVVSLRSAQANTWRKSQLTAIKRFASNVANSVNGQDKTVGLWLLGCAGAVSGVVAIGGLGRLKESRFTGVSGFNFRTKPPSTDKEWEEQFKQFSSHPEYSDKGELHGKAGMTLTDFKMIWRLNYYHYMALMGVPVVFFLPAALFWFSGRLSSRMQKYVMAGAGLQLIQGGLAWSQAKRGIDPLGRTDKDLSSPTKQFRLANHLVLSYSQYILFVWAGLSALLRQTNISSIQHLGTLRTMAAGSKAAVIGTVLMGGMMAATDAGLVHNDWPSYSGHFIPQDFFEKSPFYRNFYESLGTIQMAHRHLAYIAASAVTGTWLYARRLALPSRVRMALNVMLAVVWMQAVLGVTTLRNHCDTSIASLHQLGSVSLVTAAVWFMHELRRIPK